QQAEGRRRLLMEWETVTTEQVRRAQQGLEHSALDQRSDRISNDLQARAAELERLAQPDQSADIVHSRHLFYGLLMFWSSVVAVSAASLLRAETERRKA